MRPIMQNAARSSEPGSVRAGPRTGGFVRSDRPGSPRVAPILSLGSLVEPTRVAPIRGTRVRIALPLPPHNPLAPRASDALSYAPPRGPQSDTWRAARKYLFRGPKYLEGYVASSRWVGSTCRVHRPPEGI